MAAAITSSFAASVIRTDVTRRIGPARAASPLDVEIPTWNFPTSFSATELLPGRVSFRSSVRRSFMLLRGRRCRPRCRYPRTLCRGSISR